MRPLQNARQPCPYCHGRTSDGRIHGRVAEDGPIMCLRPAPNRTELQIIGELLAGDVYLYGKRCRLTWPDGPPFAPDQMTLLSESLRN